MTSPLPIQLQVILLKKKDCQYFTFYSVAFTPNMFCAPHLLSVTTLSPCGPNFISLCIHEPPYRSSISQHATVTLRGSNKYAPYAKKEKAHGEKNTLRYFIAWIIHTYANTILIYKIHQHIIYGCIFLLDIVQAMFTLYIEMNTHMKLIYRPSM